MSKSNCTADAVFTPRRSLRLSKLEVSMKEDLQTSGRDTSVANRTPRFPKPELTNDEEGRRSGPHSSEEYSSGGIPKNQKKRNKKSKKQKAKANQKRKQAKKLQSQNSSGDNTEDVKETESSEETVQNGIITSAAGFNSTGDDVGEASPMEDVPCPVEVESKLEIVNEFSGCEGAASSLPHSPVFSSAFCDKVIDLVTPELMQSESLPKDDDAPPSELINVRDGDEQMSEGVGGVLEETFELPPSEGDQAEESAPITVRAADDASKVSKMRSSMSGPRYSSTPARHSLLDRRSTSLKPVREDSSKKERTSDVSLSTPKKYVLFTPISAAQTAKTPLKSALRRSRRSLSLDTALNTIAKKGVIFHSPSNTTILIDEVDSIMKSKKKQPVEGGEGGEEKYVPVRRKRSLSVAETEEEKEVVRQLQPTKEDVSHAKNWKRDPTPSSRVKLPNFAAIHQQQFEKMESIWDHVARKTERAKVLSSSKSKQDKGNLMGSQKKEVKQPGDAAGPTAAPPKARQRIELSNIRVAHKIGTKDVLNPKPKEDKEKLNGSLKKDVKRLNTHSKPVNVSFKARQGVELPNNRVTKPVLSKAIKTVTSEIRKKILVTTNPIKAAEVEEDKSKSTTAPSHKTVTSKAADRQKEHTKMYKSSGHTVSTVLQDERKEQKDYITGVRSNRRFMLQMQHRDRIK